MSDSDASGENEQEKTPEVSPRPSTAAARRERRSSTRPAGKSEAKADDKTRPAGKAKPGDKTEKAKDAKGAATPKRDRKAKQASPFARLVRFIREVWAELRKVIWPNRKQMVTYTAVVLIFVVFMVALVSGLDLAFKQVVGAVFGS